MIIMEIVHRPEENRFVAEVDGFTAYVEYQLGEGSFDILHTIVPKEIGGRGIAGELVRAAYDYAEAQGWEKLSSCSYAARWLERHQ